MAIKFYKTKEPYGCFSNYYKSRFFVFGKWWNWSEAPYQAAKTNIQSEIDEIHKAIKANDTRLLGQKVTMRPDWDQVKYSVMKEVCLAKFLQCHELRQILMSTGDEELIEDSPVDYYWGCGADGSGKNMLGKLLMEIRSELADE